MKTKTRKSVAALIGWVILLLALILAKPGILALVDAIEADDPLNPAIINGYHYPAAAFLYALMVAPFLVASSLLSICRNEPLKYISMLYGLPALCWLAYFIARNHLDIA